MYELKMAIQSTAGEMDWGVAMATVVAMIPPLIIPLLPREQFLRALTLVQER